MVKLQHEDLGLLRHPRRAFWSVGSYLQTAAKYSVGCLGALTRLYKTTPGCGQQQHPVADHIQGLNSDTPVILIMRPKPSCGSG